MSMSVMKLMGKVMRLQRLLAKIDKDNNDPKLLEEIKTIKDQIVEEAKRRKVDYKQFMPQLDKLDAAIEANKNEIKQKETESK